MRQFTNSICMLLAGLLLAVATTGCDKTKSPVDAAVLPPALAALEKGAANGEIEAQYRLALAYLGWEDAPKKEGPQTPWEKDPIRRDDLDKFPVDEVKAALWLEKAAAQGHVGAQRELGLLYLPKFVDPDDYLPPLPPGAVLDKEPNAVRVEKAARTAMAWFAKAAANGDAESQLQLGIAYATGNGVDTNRDESIAWYRKAAEQGNRSAQFNLGVQLLQSNPSADAAREGVGWLEKAAAQGFAAASSQLGWMYWEGAGVERDKTIAVKHYLKAAEGGNAYAQRTLGGAYYGGLGAEKDLPTAAMWIERAAMQGDTEAEAVMGFLHYEGEGLPKDAAKASDWYQKAARKGHQLAQRELGLMYFKGDGRPEDKVLGYAWVNLASTGGDESTVSLRNSLERSMSSQEIAESQRLASSWKVGETLARTVTASAGTQPGKSAGTMAKAGSGTVFVVSSDGHAITNQHVVNGCKELRLQGTDSAFKLVTADVVNDLALLKLPEPEARSAPLSTDPAKTRQGEEIVVFGFPLNSVLSSGGNLTPGVVSALTGLGNNTNQIQITAPVQPGSSGSPVLNKKGEVVAVVSQKLSDSVMAKATGSVGQNVNFAVNGQTLRSFLDANQIKYKSGAGFFAGEKSTADLADAARQWTRVVECWK